MAKEDWSDIGSPVAAGEDWSDLGAPLGSPPKKRSAIGEILNQGYAGAVVELPRMAGQALQYTSDPGRPVYEFGKSIADAAKARGEAPALQPQPEQHNVVTNALAAGARMLPQSVAPAAVVGAGLATLPVSAPVALGGAAVLGSLPAALSQGQETLDNAREAGVSEDQALRAARTNAVIEGGGETLGTWAGGKLLGIGATAVRRVIGQGAERTAGNVLGELTSPSVMKPWLRQLPQTAAVEVGTEIGQNAGERYVEQQAGIAGPSPWEAGKEAIAPTLGMTALLAPFGLAGFAGGAYAGRRRAAALSAGDAPAELRQGIADDYATQLQAVDPAAADEFRRRAGEAIRSNTPLTLDDSLFAAPAPTLAMPARAQEALAAQEAAPSYTLTTDPAPLQQRIDAALAINTARLSRAQRTRYEQELQAALAEPVGISHDANGLERPLTLGEYLDAQDEVVQARQSAQQAETIRAQRITPNLQQLADEESETPPAGPLTATVARQASIAALPDVPPAPSEKNAPAPIAPVSGPLTKALSITSGVPHVPQTAETEQAKTQGPQQRAEDAGLTAQAPAAAFDVSARNESQLRYLSTNGQPGWKEAAIAELAKRQQAAPATGSTELAALQAQYEQARANQDQAAMRTLVEPIKAAQAKAAPAAPKTESEKGLRVGTNALNAQPVSVRNGTIHIGDEPAYDYESGDPVTIADNASPQALADALTKSGALTNKHHFYGLPKQEAAPAPAAEVRRGEVGMKLAPGETVKTASGRPTTPFPKTGKGQKLTPLYLKQVDRWLMQNALDEATARGDTFNATQFRANLDKPQQADKDGAEEYLFGQQPAVAPSILKPLVPPSTNGVPKSSEISTPAPAAHWLNDQGDNREAVLARMRDLRARAEGYAKESRDKSPTGGALAVGSAHVEAAQKEQGLSTFLQEIGKGKTPQEAATEAKKVGALVAENWKKQRPNDYQTHLSPTGADTLIDDAMRALLQAKPAPAAPEAKADYTPQEQYAAIIDDLPDPDVERVFKRARLAGKNASTAEKRAMLRAEAEADILPIIHAMDDANELGQEAVQDAADRFAPAEDWDYQPEHFPAPAQTIDLTTSKLPEISPEEAAQRLAEWKAEAARMGREEDHSNEVIISLFDASGAISEPWRTAGYDVMQYDIKLGDDLLTEFPMADLAELKASGKKVVGVLAQPPCTTFTSTGRQWWATRHDVHDRAMVNKMFGPMAAKYFSKPLEYTKALVAAVDTIIGEVKPGFFLMENPNGGAGNTRIMDVMGLPAPSLIMHPANFGDPYTKKTLLWGTFKTDLPTANVAPTQGSLMHKLWSRAEKDGGKRSQTPEGFAYALFMANKTAPVAMTEQQFDYEMDRLAEEGDQAQADELAKRFPAHAARRAKSQPQKTETRVQPAPAAEKPAAPAQHQEGNQTEPATPAVIASALRTGDRNSRLSLAQIKAEGLRQIDAALAAVPTDQGQQDWEAQLEITAGEKGGNAHQEAVAKLGHVTIDIPGDGQFKIVRSRERLTEFRAAFEKAASVTGAGPRERKTPDWQKTGKGGAGNLETLRDFLLDGESLAAYEYAKQIGKPLIFGKYNGGWLTVPYFDAQPFASPFGNDFELVTARTIAPDGNDRWAVIDLGTGGEVGTPQATRLKAAAVARSGLENMGRSGLEAAQRSVKQRTPDQYGPQAQLEKAWLEGIDARDEDAARQKWDEWARTERRIPRTSSSTPYKGQATEMPNAIPAMIKARSENKTDWSAIDWKGFARADQPGGGAFELRDGQVTVKVELMNDGFYQASVGTVESSPRLTVQQAVDWAALYRSDVTKPTETDTSVDFTADDVGRFGAAELARRAGWFEKHGAEKYAQEPAFVALRAALKKEFGTDSIADFAGGKVRGESATDASIAHANAASESVPEGVTLGSFKHTKTGVPQYAVAFKDRVERPVFDQAKAIAERYKARYSAFRGNGAIPGFLFTDEAQARAFAAEIAPLTAGQPAAPSAAPAATTEAPAPAKPNPAVAKLRELADKLEADAEKRLNADRQTNTRRRAEMAGHAIAQAERDVALARTMRNLANAIEAGEVTHLAKLRSKAQVEMLNDWAASAQSKSYSSYAEQQQRKGEPATPAMMENVEWLRYTMDKGDLLRTAEKIKAFAGGKVLAVKLERDANSGRDRPDVDADVAEAVMALMEKYHLLRQLGWYWPHVKERLGRLKAMGITNRAELVAALKEFVAYRGDRAQADPVKALERKLVGQKVGIDFFPTPPALAQRMAQLAGIEAGDLVLEPSAGNGNLADAAKKAGGQVEAVEVSDSLREILQAKGHALVGRDFEDFAPGKQYDKIIMNPPFSNGQDMAHVRRAFELLKPGGRLVAIVGEGAFFRSDKQATAFRDWLDEQGATNEKLPENSFMDRTQLATTGTNARLVVLDKDKAAEAAPVATQPEVKPAIPEGVVPAGEPFYRNGTLTQGYAPFALDARVTLKDSAGQTGNIESFVAPDENAVFQSAIVRFDNGVTQNVRFSQLTKAAEAPKTTRHFRDLATLNALTNPIFDGEWVRLADGSEWQARLGYTGRGWALVNNKQAHPTANNLVAQTDFIAAILAADQAATAPAKAAAPVDAARGKAPSAPAWHTVLPSEGLPITDAELKTTGYRLVAGRLAAEAVSAVTQLQLTNGMALYAYYLPAAEGKNGRVRLVPDDQTPPAPWKLLDSQALRPATVPADVMTARLTSLLQSAPVIGTPSETKTEAKASPKASVEASAKASPAKSGARPDPGRYREGNAASRDGQMALADRAGRIAALGAMNKQLRNMGGNAYTDAEIEHATNYDAMQDWLSAQIAAPTPAGKIADFGEKLEGAAKDRVRVFKERLAEDVDIETMPLSKAWPEPDYQALLDDGMDKTVVAFIRAARDEVPAKPRAAWKVPGWAKRVKLLRDFARDLLDGGLTDALKARLAEDANDYNPLSPVLGRVELYERVGHAHSLAGIYVKSASYGLYNRVQYNPPKTIWTVEGPPEKSSWTNWPKEYASADTREEAIAQFVAKYDSIFGKTSEAPAEEKAAEVKFDIYSRGNSKVIIVGKKTGRSYLDLKTFATTAEARAYRSEHHAELVALLEQAKAVPEERRTTNSPRVGADHRHGADVTPEQFHDTFGFRGEQFGNSMPQKERQSNLNQAYDALMDLAGVLGVPAKALSLNGELGLAFGARGTGGKNAPAAHYEPDTTGAVTPNRVVINLTRHGGPGSLAHEWFHGVDNYFARLRGEKGGHLTQAPRARGAGVRPEMVAAFAAVDAAIKQSGMAKRAAELDSRRSKDYWGGRHEMAARAFESYIVAKLQANNGANDYLANIVSKEFWDAQEAVMRGPFAPEGEKVESYPYPTEAEQPAITAAFDKFFQTVQTKETEQGVALFSRRSDARDKLFPGFNPLTHPNHEQTATLQRLKDQLTREADRAQVSAAGIERITLQSVPDAYTGFADAIERLFGVRIQFVHAQGLAQQIGFNGLYLGGRTLIVNVNSKAPYSTIIGHEFLHQLRRNKPLLYQAFANLAEGYMTDKAHAHRKVKEKEYRRAGRDQQEAVNLGFEEVNADAFGDLWGDESFWKDLAGRQGKHGIVARVLEQLRGFLHRILRAVKAWSQPYETQGFFTDPAALRQAVLDTTQAALAEKARWVGEADGFLRRSFDAPAPTFYSALARAFEAAPAKIFTTGNQVKLWLAGNAAKLGLKKDEIEWSGINDYLTLRGKEKVTAAEVHAFLDENNVVVAEVEKQGIYETFGTARTPEESATKYVQYTVPGGRDYRELLLTLPEKPSPGKYWAVEDTINPDYPRWMVASRRESDGEIVYTGRSHPTKAAAEKAIAEMEGKANSFRSGHWDEPNVLAHVRFDTREDADGRRVLFLQEIQSDWGQVGKKLGFKPSDADERRAKLEGDIDHLRENEKALDAQINRATRDIEHHQGVRGREAETAFHTDLRRELSDRRDVLIRDRQNLEAELGRLETSSRVPTAPFVTDTQAWVALALKRMVKYAADNGFEAIAWANGQQNADHYDLSKQVDQVSYSDDGIFRAFQGRKAVIVRKAAESELPDIVGKEVAQRLLDAPMEEGRRVLLGEELKVGGEGMRAFYDKLVPQVASTVLKKLGAGPVETIALPDASFGVARAKRLGLVKDGETINHSGYQGFSLPAALRDQVRREGLPLFSRPTRELIGDSGRDYTEAQQAMHAHVGRTVDVPTLVDRLKTYASQRWVQGIFDQFDPIKAIDAGAYRLARLAKGAAGAFEAFMHHGKLSLQDGVYDADRTGGVMQRVFFPLGKESTDFLYWVAGNRAEGLLDEADRAHAEGARLADGAKRLEAEATAKEAAARQMLQQAGDFPKQMTGNQRAQKENAKRAVALQRQAKALRANAAAMREKARELAGVLRERLFTREHVAAAKSLADGETTFDYTLADGTVTRQRAAIYADTLVKFNAFNRNVLDMAEQSGLIDGAARPYWESEFYVPFYRVIDEDEGGVRGMNIKQGIVRQQAFKHLKGGTEGLNDLLANTLMNWAHLIDASAKNRAAKATLEAAEALGAARPAEAGEKKTVWYMDQGRRREYAVDDPALLVAINGLDYAGLRGPAMDALSATKRWLTMGVTASPFFKVRNLIRDSLQAIGTGQGMSYNPLKNVREGGQHAAFGGALKNVGRALVGRPTQDLNVSQAYVSALAGGGLIRFGTMLEGNEAARTRQLIKQGTKDETILDSEPKWRAFYDRYLEPLVAAYNELGNQSEEINRMALYEQARAQGKSHAEAALLARDLMDFSMQGSFALVRFFAQVVPFFNARLVGMAKLGRSAKEDPARLAFVTAGVALGSLALLAAYGDDDDWKKREDWDRDTYWWFKLGGVAYRIPKPFEIGAIGTLAERSAELIFDDEMTGQRFRQAVVRVLDNQLMMNPTPQLIKPILDIYANKDSFTKRPIESLAMQRLEPAYRYTAATSLAARGASAAVGGAVSPVEVDHLVRAYFGWLGSAVFATADMAIRTVADEPARPAGDLLKTMTGNMAASLDSTSSRYVTWMYEQAKEVEEAYGTYRQLRKEQRFDEAATYRAEHADELRKYHRLETAKRDSSLLAAQIRHVENNRTLTAEEKRARILQLRQRQHDLAQRAVR